MGWRILSKSGATLSESADINPCDHGVVFDAEAARELGWLDVRKRFPRLDGTCPKGCGFVGISYASAEHYFMGDW